MKHLKTFEQLNESQSAYYEMMSEHPWLIDDVRFDEYVINHNDKQETIYVLNGELTMYLNNEEYLDNLLEKLEQKTKILKTIKKEDDFIEEVVDIYELLEYINREKIINMDDLLIKKHNKYIQKGGFDKKLFLVSTNK